jgi:hypothetical protein
MYHTLSVTVLVFPIKQFFDVSSMKSFFKAVMLNLTLYIMCELDNNWGKWHSSRCRVLHFVTVHVP